MLPSPFRVARSASRRRSERGALGNWDLLFPLALFWFVSAFRVVYAIVASETFGVGSTLALVAVVVIPFAIVRGLLASRRRRSP